MSKGLHFPDNLMSIFGFKRVEEDEATTGELTKMSEESLGKLWNTPEEDEAWKYLNEKGHSKWKMKNK